MTWFLASEVETTEALHDLLAEVFVGPSLPTTAYDASPPRTPISKHERGAVGRRFDSLQVWTVTLPVVHGEDALWAVAHRAARSLIMAMKYAPLVLVMRRSRLAWRVSEIAIQRSPSGCSRITFR